VEHRRTGNLRGEWGLRSCWRFRGRWRGGEILLDKKDKSDILVSPRRRAGNFMDLFDLRHAMIGNFDQTTRSAHPGAIWSQQRPTSAFDSAEILLIRLRSVDGISPGLRDARGLFRRQKTRAQPGSRQASRTEHFGSCGKLDSIAPDSKKSTHLLFARSKQDRTCVGITSRK
jgi:hypothetical protein